jgi:hypothetical protein
MACVFGFQELANRNRFVQDLEGQGYLLDFIGGYFVIYGLPYLNARGELVYGDWASPVDLSTDGSLDAPSNHQAWFRGGRPHDQNGRPLRLGGGEDKVQVAEDFVADHSFSYKLLDDTGRVRAYRSFEEKVVTYLDTITAPALAAFPDASPLQALERKATEQGTPLRLPDTLSSRYHMNDVSRLLVGKKVAIVGLGGTGSYILDFVARTHLAEIALFDDDTVHVHTLFRFPGYIPRAAIGMLKVDALFMQYANWHGNIVAIPERVTNANIEKLRNVDFVFLALDDGPSRILIADWLSANGIPFVDCGMGLNRVAEGLNGVVRVTGTDRAAFEATAKTRFLPGGDPEGGEYRKQGQIAELNALNAALAVVRFKQHFGVYDRENQSHSMILETSTFEVDKPGEGS